MKGKGLPTPPRPATSSQVKKSSPVVTQIIGLTQDRHLRVSYENAVGNLRGKAMDYLMDVASNRYSCTPQGLHDLDMETKDFYSKARDAIKEQARQETPTAVLDYIKWKEGFNPERKAKKEARSDRNEFEVIESATRPNPSFQTYMAEFPEFLDQKSQHHLQAYLDELRRSSPESMSAESGQGSGGGGSEDLS